MPPALSTLLGEKSPLYILPSAASDEERQAWQALAEGWSGASTPRFALDSELDDLPPGDAWILGRDNMLAEAVHATLAVRGVSLEDEELLIGHDSVPLAEHSHVLVARHPADPRAALGWIGAHSSAVIPALARKLPHYTRYTYLGFRGDEGENVAKGQWDALHSPLSLQLGEGEPVALVLPERAPLAAKPPAFDGDALAALVGQLADPALEGRGLGSAGLETASALIEERFARYGLAPAGDDGYRQRWTEKAGQDGHPVAVSNVLGRLPGAKPALENEPVLVLAHVDHLGRGWPDVRQGEEGKIHPGADDNASGVAVLLELARTLAAEPPRARPVLFAAVTAEEAGRLGSKALLAELLPETKPSACVNFDTVGRLGDGKLHVLHASSAREWRYIFMGVQYTTGVPVSIVTEPLDASDQVSCIERGIPGVQLFTGAHADYHRPSDTADKIDAAGLAKVTEAAAEVVRYLAEREEALSVQEVESGKPRAHGEGHGHGGGKGARRASLGTVPDFGFGGPGVRVQALVEDSPAAKAGLQPGDVLVALAGEEVKDLRGYAGLLRKHAPGDEVCLTILRGEETLKVTVTLGTR